MVNNKENLQRLSERVDGTIARFAGSNHRKPGCGSASNMISKAFLLGLCIITGSKDAWDLTIGLEL